jgi:predicted HTH transcriptional regulator
MRPDQLRLLGRLSNGEDGLVERKPQTVKNEELRRTVVAFANTVRDGQTAVLFIAVSNTGSVLGVDNPDELQKRINRVTKDCYPRIKAQSYELQSDGKRFIAVEISPSDNALCKH